MYTKENKYVVWGFIMTNILKIIYKEYDSFTPSKRRIADYIINHTNYITYDTLSELADKIGTSTTSIVRFAQSLGFDGYSGLQTSIRDYTHADDPFNASKTLDNIEHKTTHDLFKQSIDKDIENLNQTLKTIDPSLLEAAVSRINTARNVYIIGYNDSFTLAYYMTMRLGQIRENVHLLQSVGGVYPYEIVDSNEEDLLIAYWFPRYSLYTLNIINRIKKNNGNVIIITSSNTEKIKEFGDIILPTHVYGGGVKESLIAPISLSSYLVSLAAVKDYDKASKYIKESEKILQNGFYLDT